MKFKDTHYGDLTGQHYKDDIELEHVGLTSLEGAPKMVSGGFYVGDNNLTSLKYAPEYVTGDFDCYRNKLVSLEYLPKHLGSGFWASQNKNPHLEQEFKLRQKNPGMSENQINIEMYKLTKDKIYLPDALKKVFLIKD